MPSTPSAKYNNRTPVQKLADALDAPIPRVADKNIIPLGLVLEAADFFEVDLDDEVGTAEARLQILIDEAGLSDSHGVPLHFSQGHSATIATHIAKRIINDRTALDRQKKRVKPARLEQYDIAFEPAQKKIEVVNRISALTVSGPETLGPGSKERKTVLENLYRGLRFGEPPSATKSKLGAILAKKLHANWDARCHSTGETLTLEGLNRLLYAATKHIEESSFNKHQLTVEEEASAYSGAIIQTLLEHSVIDSTYSRSLWDGRKSVTTMVDSKYRNAKQTEWPGWFFEYCAIKKLRDSFGGGPAEIGTVEFDYQGKRTWDLKSHTEPLDSSKPSSSAPLNDKDSMRRAVEDGGLGFIMLCGVSLYDNEQDFYEWHYTKVRGHKSKERSINSRKLKTGFELRSLEFYYIDSIQTLERLEMEQIISDFKQGKQADGSPRKLKYKMNVDKARQDKILVKRIDIPEYLSAVHQSGETISSLPSESGNILLA